MPNEAKNTSLPLIMKMANVEVKVEVVKAPCFQYDHERQVTTTDETMSGESSGCTKATYSTEKVGKDPEGDYAADD